MERKKMNEALANAVAIVPASRRNAVVETRQAPSRSRVQASHSILLSTSRLLSHYLNQLEGLPGKTRG